MGATLTVLAGIEAQAKREFLPIFGEEQAAYLEWLVRERRPCRAIEIGALVGYATIRIARNLPDGCALTAIEIGTDLARRAEANVALAGLSAKARIVRGDAREALDAVPGPIDLLLLDAERSQYLHHLKSVEAKLAPSATVVAAGVGKGARLAAAYLDYVRKSPRYESEHRVFGDDAMEVSRFLG